MTFLISTFFYENFSFENFIKTFLFLSMPSFLEKTHSPFLLANKK